MFINTGYNFKNKALLKQSNKQAKQTTPIKQIFCRVLLKTIKAIATKKKDKRRKENWWRKAIKTMTG